MNRNQDQNSQSTQSRLPIQTEQVASDNNHKKRSSLEAISYEKWRAKYCPIKNLFFSKAPYGGILFRPCGMDFQFVRRCPLRNIWTLLDDGDLGLLIIEGYFCFDYSGYFVTEIPAPDDRIFRIKMKPFYNVKD